MAADPFRREYRADLGTFAMAFLMGFFFLVVAIVVWRGENTSAVMVLMSGLLVGILVLYLGTSMWTRTYVSRDRIVKRGLFRTIATPWQAIQGIEIRRGNRRSWVVIYDCQGREIDLPHLDASETDIEKEVRVLREIWEKRRGPHWKPIFDTARASRRDWPGGW
ncbi:PH domain-containing protein [Actinomadura sp. 6N118]|uniref:PH domain-containing protein n=1 Tax=Actinomadura sp. 6N118 TaxID=3375151 RepID=UPI0037893F44